MLKSIQWKLAAIFVLLVVAMMTVFGTFMQSQISSFYHNSFAEQMDTAFSAELTDILEDSAKGNDVVKKMKSILDIYSGRLGINTNRNYYILDKASGKFLDGSERNTDIKRSKNVITAMNGKVGDDILHTSSYLDYAYPVGDYIIYIYDTKDEMLNLLHTVLGLIARALLIGILISVILSIFLSRTITRPVMKITKKAEEIAEGDFDVDIDVKSNDEIGTLAQTFNYMTSVLKDTLGENAQEKKKLETIFRFMNDGIIAFNTDQSVMQINPAAKKMFNITDESEVRFNRFFKKLGTSITMTEMLYFDHYSTIERDISWNGKHYKAYFALFTIDNERQGNGVVVAFHDVTASQNLDASRREFVANVSHELRTPLTTIKGYAETLYETTEDEDEKKFLGIISREVDRMTRLIKELLTLSSLDHNKLNIMKTEFSLDDLINDVVTKLTMQAEDSGLKIRYTRTTEIPEIFADVDRIEQVITNVIGNSIKYTPEGGEINVYAGFLYNEAYIKIHDNGIGIPKKDLNKVFDRFYRVDKARSRENGGTGLGLAIASEIIELHGGSISVDSEYGKWTEVTIKIPRGEPERRKV